MLLYFALLFLLLSFCLVKETDRTRWIYWGGAVLLAILAGLRSEFVSKDYYEYVDIYNNYYEYSVVVMEPMIISLSWVSHQLSENVKLFFLLYAILGVFLKFYVIEKMSSFPFFSVVFYYVHYFLLHEMTQIRIGVAIGFILLMIKAICDNKKISYLFLILAIISHYSTIICVLFFFIDRKKINIKLYVLLPLIALLLYLSGISTLSFVSKLPLGVFSMKISAYLNLMNEGIQDYINVFNIQYIMQVILGYLFLCTKKSGIDKYTILLVKIYMWGLFVFLIFTDIPAVAFRLSEIFLIVEIILIPKLLLLFKPKIMAKITLSMFAFLLLLLYVYKLELVGSYSF